MTYKGDINEKVVKAKEYIKIAKEIKVKESIYIYRDLCRNLKKCSEEELKELEN